MVLCKFALPVLKAGPKRYKMPLHFVHDVNAVEVVSKQLASLPLEIDAWDHAHKMLRCQEAIHKRALTVDGGPIDGQCTAYIFLCAIRLLGSSSTVARHGVSPNDRAFGIHHASGIVRV